MNDAIVFEDDPFAGNLTADLLRQLGFRVHLYPNGIDAISVVRSIGPRLVVVDIMMPGLDGITICRTLKQNPITKEIKVIVMSGKSFQTEQARALKNGADLFILKPYEGRCFMDRVVELVGVPTPDAGPSAGRPAAKTGGLPVTVWGCRSAATARPAGSRYGNQSPCLSVTLPDDRYLLLDCGGGAAAFVQQLSYRPAPKKVWLLLSSLHAERVLGLPDLLFARKKSWEFRIGGPRDDVRTLEEVVWAATAKKGFPEKFFADKLETFEILEDSIVLSPDLRVSALYANHPGAALGYAVQTAGKRLVYVPDSEIPEATGTGFQNYGDKLKAFCRGADLLVHDSWHAPEDYAQHSGDGHSSVSRVVDVAVAAGVKTLMLFNLNPSYSDEQVDRIFAAVQMRLRSERAAAECVIATDGHFLQL